MNKRTNLNGNVKMSTGLYNVYVNGVRGQNVPQVTACVNVRYVVFQDLRTFSRYVTWVKVNFSMRPADSVHVILAGLLKASKKKMCRNENTSPSSFCCLDR